MPPTRRHFLSASALVLAAGSAPTPAAAPAGHWSPRLSENLADSSTRVPAPPRRKPS